MTKIAAVEYVVRRIPMHEMSYVVRLVNRAVETAQERQAEKVRRLVVSVGEMTDVLPEYLHRYYGTAVQGTLLEDSVLEIRSEPVRVRCAECGREYHPDRGNGYSCPSCHSSAGSVTAGRGVTLEQVELELPDGTSEERHKVINEKGEKSNDGKGRDRGSESKRP